MEFEFNRELTAQNFVDINNIGVFALEAINSSGMYYYYTVQTIMGTSVIASCGPIIPDLETLPENFSIKVYQISYNENKLARGISLFLNDKEKQIVDAREIDINDCIAQFRDVKEYLKNLSLGIF